MQPVAQIIITLKDDGNLAIGGKVPGEIIARGMLDKAKDMIVAHIAAQTAEANAPALLLANGSLPRSALSK